MTTASKAVCGVGEAEAALWLPISTAPTDRPVVVRQRTDNLQGGWFVATVKLPDPDAEEGRFHGSSTILHYNGTFLMSRFYGTWTHWLCDDPAALASTARAAAGDWADFSADEIVRRTRCEADDRSAPDTSNTWRTCCDLILVRLKAAAPAVPASARSGAGEGENRSLFSDAIEIISTIKANQEDETGEEDDVLACLLERLRAALAASPPAPAEHGVEIRAADELTEAEIRSRAAALVRSSGWQPGYSLHGKAVLDLMTKLGMSLITEPPQDRCAHPDCGCEHDSVCDAALSQRGQAGGSDPAQSPSISEEEG